MKTDAPLWPQDRICLQPARVDVAALAADVYERTCRSGFEQPGFCVVRLGSLMSPVAFRQLMVDLKRAMARLHESETGKTLAYLSALRVDQQQTTRLHLDGGPPECFLMLGYEPSAVASEIAVADYTRCAFDLGLSPDEFMSRHNPMFQPDSELLRPYTTRLACFCPAEFQIVCINNSSAPFSRKRPRWQGVLHTATIAEPDALKPRVINSTMIAPASGASAEAVTDARQQAFVAGEDALQRGY